MNFMHKVEEAMNLLREIRDLLKEIRDHGIRTKQ